MNSQYNGRRPFPPLTQESALLKVRMAEDAWNNQDPKSIALAYTADSQWRNRNEFYKGHEEIIKFLTNKWSKEHEYRLIKELWCHNSNRIAVRFAYEWHNDKLEWFRSYGNENWEFDNNGLMRCRYASINDLSINEYDRKFHWPNGVRPNDYPGLKDLLL
jgi:nuclear transport factor 2 (NTF2) superfamily protein